MKKIILLTAFICFLLSACSEGNIEKDATTPTVDEGSYSVIIVKASNLEDITSSDMEEPIVFTGNDILWFNEITKEIRFNNNLSMKAAFSNVEALKFYIEDEYLFFTFVFVDSSIPQDFYGMFLVYNTTENKFFLRDNPSPYSSQSISEDPTDENQTPISPEWKKFIDQLVIERKYKN